MINLWTDGSYLSSTNSAGWGFVAVDAQDNVIKKRYGTIADPRLKVFRNCASEIVAAVMAIEWALEAGHTKIVIHTDNTGVIKWATGRWKRNNVATQGYHAWFLTRQNQADYRWNHVKGHSGVKWNEEADSLAKCGSQLPVKMGNEFSFGESICLIQEFKDV